MRRYFPAVLGITFLISPVFAEPATRPAGVTTAPATRPSAMGEFLRFVDNGSAGGRLETADAIFVSQGGAVVRLVSAVHIGEHAYFEQLNEQFKKHDAVLYEMVKPKDVQAPVRGQRTGSGVGELQRFLKDSLALDYQLDVVDYTQPNFIHADLDAETFAKMQEDRGETFEMMFLKSLLKAMHEPPPAAAQEANQDPEKTLEELVKLISRPDMERQLKIILARNMANVELSGMGLDQPGGSVIVTERNKVAIDVLQKALKDGRKNIAIFYGAAHMPDMSQRLRDLGFKQVATEWRMAWDLTIRNDQPSAVEKMLLELIRGLDEADQ